MRRGRPDHLHRPSVDRIKSRSPDLVAPDNLNKTPLEDVGIKRSAPMHRKRFGVDGKVRGHLRMEPDLLLRMGEREWPLRCAGTDRRQALRGYFHLPAKKLIQQLALGIRKVRDGCDWFHGSHALVCGSSMRSSEWIGYRMILLGRN